MDILTTRSLDPKLFPFKKSELESFSLIVSDIDYTILDFEKGHKAGVNALSKSLGNPFGLAVDEMFHLMIQGYRKRETELWDRREEFNQISMKAEVLQQEFAKKHGAKI